MKIRTVTLCLLFCLFSLSLFALKHDQEAPLWEHLMDVNVQWDHQVTDHSPYQELVRFEDDTERIRTHLTLVEGILRSRTPEGLSSTQHANRMRLLNHLRDYHEAGVFPRNYSLRNRTPFFIDVHGTACAVGYLLIQDGQEDFAQKISQELNNAYLLDMPYPEIGHWASINGFTPEELAWIQPGYAYEAHGMYPIANPAPNGEVTFLYNDEVNDRLLICGNYTSIAGITGASMVTWDGSNFSYLGGILNGTPETASIYNGELERVWITPGSPQATCPLLLETEEGGVSLGWTLALPESHAKGSSSIAVARWRIELLYLTGKAASRRKTPPPIFERARTSLSTSRTRHWTTFTATPT